MLPVFPLSRLFCTFHIRELTSLKLQGNRRSSLLLHEELDEVIAKSVRRRRNWKQLATISIRLDQQAPTPPQKEPFAQRAAPPASPSKSSATGLSDSVALEEDGAGLRGPPPVQPPPDADGAKKQAQPSVSVEQAAKPTFYITVGDPHKVGDLTSSHIVYQVSTKVTVHYSLSEALGSLWFGDKANR